MPDKQNVRLYMKSSLYIIRQAERVYHMLQQKMLITGACISRPKTRRCQPWGLQNTTDVVKVYLGVLGLSEIYVFVCTCIYKADESTQQSNPRRCIHSPHAKSSVT